MGLKAIDGVEDVIISCLFSPEEVQLFAMSAVIRPVSLDSFMSSVVKGLSLDHVVQCH